VKPAAPQPTRQTAPARVETHRVVPSTEAQAISSAPLAIARLQRAAGNRVMARFLASSVQRKCKACEEDERVQAKLTVNQAGDEYEREADRVADRVMRTPEPTGSVQRAPIQIQRLCKECEEDDEHVQRQTADAGGERVGDLFVGDLVVQRRAAGDASAGPLGASLEGRVHAFDGRGQPLPADERRFMEARFGYGFGPVRIHTGADAGGVAAAINARAFTIGSNVVFGAGEYRPGTQAGRGLLAHELAHVVQQTGGVRAIQRQPAGEEPALSQAEESRLSVTSPGRATMQPAPPALSLFNFGNDRADPKAFHVAVVRELARFLRDEFKTPMRVRVVGHASAPGSGAHNLELSRRRAQAIAAILRAEGVSQVEVLASGESDPIASNDTVDGRSRNRRVDLHLSARAPGPQPKPEPPGPGPEPKPPEPPKPPQPPVPPKPPKPEKTLCEKYPILCTLVPPPLPLLPFLVCLIAPELCLLVACLVDPLLCVPPLPPEPPEPPKPPDKPDKPDPPPVVIFGRVRAANTPAAMNDRIPDAGSTPVGVLVTGLKPSMGAITIARVGNSADNGEFQINGGASASITGSTLLQIDGTSQTEPKAGAFNLHLEALFGGARVGFSGAFAVSDIMENMRTRFHDKVVDVTGARLEVLMSWDSDGAAGIKSLDLMEYQEQLDILIEEGSMIGLGLGAHGNFPVADRDQVDKHGTPATVFGAEGRQELLQIHALFDHRTNSTAGDIPVTNSGFGITRVVEPDPGRPGCLQFVVTKFGLGGTVNKMTSRAGSGRAQLIVKLPCGGGGGTPTPTIPTLPTPHVGPIPSGTRSFSYVRGIPTDAKPGDRVLVQIAFIANTRGTPPVARQFTTVIPCVVDDTTPSAVFLFTSNTVALDLVPSAFEPAVLGPRTRVIVPRRLIR
jgi:outer membrane protein OmpA-like peptidoglycan-associated protein